MKITSEGHCTYCKRRFSATGMGKHILSCELRKKAHEHDTSSPHKTYLLRASAGPYFVYFEVGDDAPLNAIDHYLRSLWLECCGHLSSFTIDKTHYDSESKNMKLKVKNTLSLGKEFSYIYDFGTETFLQLKVLDIRDGATKTVETLVRNDPLLFFCSCDSPARKVCAICLCERGIKGFLCIKCSKSHACGDEMFLPIVNSPRMGVCGYTG